MLLRFFLLLILGIQSSHAQRTFIGNAFDLKTNELVYVEKHTLQTNGDNDLLSTIYLDTNNQLIANRTVQFKDNKVHTYQLEQPPLNYTERVNRQANQLLFEKQTNDKNKQKTISQNNISDVVIDAGFSTFIVNHWDQLLAGETMKFSFASIDQFGLVALQIKFQEKSIRNEQPITMFSMTAANSLIRMFMKPIKIGYYDETQYLAYYQGVSNIKKSNGKHYKVRIEFPYTKEENTVNK